MDRMMDDDQKLAAPDVWPEIVRRIRARTPARIFVDRGLAYSTKMSLELRAAHASAVDAVWTEFDLQKDFPPEFIEKWNLFQVASQAEVPRSGLARWPTLCRAPFSRWHHERHRRASLASCARPADRRASRTRHRRKPLRLYGLFSALRSHGRRPQPDLQHSRPRPPHRRRRRSHHKSRHPNVRSETQRHNP